MARADGNRWRLPRPVLILLDVNVLLTAHREELAHHNRVAGWLTDSLNARGGCGISDLVLSGFLRISTHPRVFNPPTPLEDALAFAAAVRDAPGSMLIRPTARHWSSFDSLCRKVEARGKTIPDAYLAALAIDAGCELITFDRGFARFPDLRWRTPPI